MAQLLTTLLIAVAGIGAAGERSPRIGPLEPAARPAAPAPRVFCERPPTLRLRRFEDGSAQLVCGGRVLARIAVPG